LSVDFGTTAGTVCEGNDPRLDGSIGIHNNDYHSVDYVADSDYRLEDDRTRKATVSYDFPESGDNGDMWYQLS